METRNSSKNDELKENNVDSSSSSAIHGKMSRSFSMDSLQILNNTPSIPAVSEVIDPSDSIFEASLDTAVSGPQLKDVNLLLPARFIGSPYAKGFKKLTNHKLNKLVQKHIVIKDDKVSLDYENEEVKAYLNQIGSVSLEKNLLLAEALEIKELAIQLYEYVFNKNEAYKVAKNTEHKAKKNRDIHEEIRCCSIISATISGEEAYFVSLSGSHKRNACRKAIEYIKEFISRSDKKIIILPSISREFKELFDYVAESQLAIPNYLKGKHCAEFTYVANLAKLFLRHGNNMKITGVVNLPILIAHVQNHVVENLGTNQERLRLYDVGDSWFLSDGISEVHHWRCCDNCINNKPLYLLMFGVMRDIRTQKNSRLSVDISLPVRESSDEELTSPLQDELLKFVESIERECVSVSLSRSGSSSVMLESPSPQVSSRRSSSRFDFSGTPQRLFSPASQLCSPIYLENGRPTEGFVSPSTVPFSSFSPSVSSFVSAVDTAKNLSSSESTPVSLLRARK